MKAHRLIIAATAALGLIVGGCGEANPDQPQGGEVLITIGGVASHLSRRYRRKALYYLNKMNLK